MSESRRDLVIGAVAAAALVGIVGALAGASGLGIAVGVVLAALIAAVADLLAVPAAEHSDTALASTGLPIAPAPRMPTPTSRPATPEEDWDRTVQRPQSRNLLASPPGGVLLAQAAKQGNDESECEDAAAVSDDAATAAVSDGASSSFGARRWAQVLVRQFVESPPSAMSATAMAEWLEQARAEMRRIAGEATATWWSEAGSEKGAFATLLGVVVQRSGDTAVARLMSVGDCCCFVVRDGSVHASLPYEDASQFGSHPALLGSLGGRHITPLWAQFELSPGDRLVLASDAVAEWVLAERERVAQVVQLAPQDLRDLLISERQAGRIVNDDVTLLALPPV